MTNTTGTRAATNRRHKVIQWATGTVGVHAVPAIVAHPGLELAGLWVHSPNKVGRDAGEICGIGPVGVTATDDVGAWWAKSGPAPRGVPPSVVEAEILNPGSTSVRVITNASGDVVTVIPR